MRAIIIAAIIVVALACAFAFGLIDISQTRETKLPEVAVEKGQMPTFDVDTAKVDVGSTTTEIEVPTVDVDTRKEKVEVPTVDVDKAN